MERLRIKALADFEQEQKEKKCNTSSRNPTRLQNNLYYYTKDHYFQSIITKVYNCDKKIEKPI